MPSDAPAAWESPAPKSPWCYKLVNYLNILQKISGALSQPMVSPQAH